MHIPGRLVWLESVANEVCCDGCGPLSLVWGDQALCSLGRERAMQHRLMSHQGGMSAGLCSPASLAHWGLVTPSPLSPHQHQQLGLATDWVISPSHPWVIWTHQAGLSAPVSWDRSWLLAFLTPKSPWPAGLTLSGPSVGKNHAIRKIKSIIYHLNTRGKGFDLRYMDNAMMYDQMCPSINVRPSTSKRWQWCNVTKMKVTLLLQYYMVITALHSWVLTVIWTVVPIHCAWLVVVPVPFCCHLTSDNQQISHWVK